MILTEQNGKKVYSDGSETELEMLKIAQEYPEDLSQDYIAEDSRYTVNNTFSAVRRNILNWYPFKPEAEVCEIGAGMGAVTGLLCDSCKSVTAVEMNELRADIIRTRYSERENLTVISEDINCWQSEKKFDYVVFVGVLEYAAVFSSEKNPFETFMLNCKKLLKDDGVLLFAIENRFGLRYWSGASEDHLQQPFVGIAGYDEGTPRTFSKAELEVLLQTTGFEKHRFYYVLPDYKFPNIICTDEWEPSYQELKKIPFTYGKNSILLFNEKNIYKDIIENHKLDFFANSFLVECAVGDLSENHVVYASCRGENKKETRIVTTINSNGRVKKLAAHNEAKVHIHNIYENMEHLKKQGIKTIPYIMNNDSELESNLFEGKKADIYFEECLKNNDFLSICKLIDALKQALLMSSKATKNEENILKQSGLYNPEYQYGLILEKGLVDMTFYNAFIENGELIFYDQEWCFEGVPLNFILYYAVKSVFNRGIINSNINLENVLEYMGIKNERKIYDRLEEYIWSTVLYRQGDIYGADGYCNLYNEEHTFSFEHNRYIHNEKELEATRTELNNKNGHIELLLESERSLNRQVSDTRILAEEYKVEAEKQKAEAEKQRVEAEKQRVEAEKQRVEAEKQRAEAEKQRVEAEKKKTEAEALQSAKEQLTVELNNKLGHIEQLLKVDREFTNLKNSRAWRMMTLMWKISGTILPHGSKRRLVVKMSVKLIKHPLLFLKKVNGERIGKFFYYLKREGASGVSRRIDDCIRGIKVQPQILDVAQINTIKERKAEDYEKLSIPKFGNITVSVVVPVYNQFEYTYNCIKSILENSGDVSYEIIIADDCSTDITRNIEHVISGLKVIHNAENLRFLRNCNNAAQFAKGQYILFLNNDTQVQKDWLKPLVDLIESKDNIGMVGSKLIYPDGRLQEAGGILWQDGSAWNYGHLADPSEPEYNYVKEVDYISGAAIMIKKNLWEEIGGFDERFAPAYCEDSDLAFEVRKHGYKVMYQPLSVVVHFEGISNGTEVTEGQKAYQVVNQKKFYEKWKDELENDHMANGEKVFLVRDKSLKRKTLLLVDHYVPQYDKDAGSRTVFQYLKLFVNMGFNIKFIGDNFYKDEPYTTTLQQLGIEVLYGPYYANNWKAFIKENAVCFDYAFLNRPHISVKYIDFIRNYTKAKIIYYGHDLHFLREMREYELTRDKALLKSSEQWKQNELSLMKKADVVYYPSIIEEREIKKIDSGINVKAIPGYLFEDIIERPYNYSRRKNIMFIGGFGHRPNVDAIVWFTEKVMPIIINELSSIKLHIIGSNPPEAVKNLASNNIIVEGFVTDEELEKFYLSCRISVVPLRYGAGIKGKVIEAMKFGMPVITTSVGAEGIAGAEDILEIVDNEEELAIKIIKLYNDEEKLNRVSKMSYKYIKNNFTPENAIKVIGTDFGM